MENYQTMTIELIYKKEYFNIKNKIKKKRGVGDKILN